jgi:hypothetical protein
MSQRPIVALIAAYNERRFLARCLEHLFRHGIAVYIVDNESTDNTREIAEAASTHPLFVGMRTLPRDRVYDEHSVLHTKEALALELDARWFIHVDPDEIHLPPVGFDTLASAIDAASDAGYTAIESLEFTFVPTEEARDHDHAAYIETMRHYYPFGPRQPHLIRAWRNLHTPVDLVSTGGHEARFAGRAVSPQPFRMKHYLFLSAPHAVEKYVKRRYSQQEVAAGWHGWRARLTPESIQLPSQRELRLTASDDDLDFSAPRTRHVLD